VSADRKGSRRRGTKAKWESLFEPFHHVYQFKVTLKHVRPPVWRRIQVPETYTFWDLHVAIQDAMGWGDMHLHGFTVPARYPWDRRHIGVPSEEDLIRVEPGWKVGIREVFGAERQVVHYVYDFGDGWEHTVRLEKILPREEGVEYPRCTGGRRACPPENCGGPWRYARLLEVLRDPHHPERQEWEEWLDRPLEPDSFDPGQVVFENPRRRLRLRRSFGF
jgi:hypothetical protein